MKSFIYVAQFRDNCGYATAARGYLKALDVYLENNPGAFGLKVYVIPLETSNSKITDEEEVLVRKYELRAGNPEVEEYIRETHGEYSIIWHMPPPMISWKDRTEGGPLWAQVKAIYEASKCTGVNISAWEATAIPKLWVDILDAVGVKKVIVPSSWNKHVYEERLPTSVKVVRIPHVIESNEGEDEIAPLLPFVKDKHVFLSVAQWQPRKGLHDLIKAYYMQFGNRDDVVLILKTYINIMNMFSLSNKQQEERISREIEEIRKSIYLDDFSNPSCKIIVIPGVLRKEQLNWLYKIADTFVLPSRGEGFCYPLAEAMRYDCNVVMPDRGGHVDLISDNDYRKKFQSTTGIWQPYEGLNGYTCNMAWYLTDLYSLRHALQKSLKKNEERGMRVLLANEPGIIGEKMAETLLL